MTKATYKRKRFLRACLQFQGEAMAIMVGYTSHLIYKSELEVEREGKEKRNKDERRGERREEIELDTGPGVSI